MSNNKSDFKDEQRNEKAVPGPTYFVNKKKNDELKRIHALDEKAYEKIKSIRPVGGAGKLGGAIAAEANQLGPTESEIMQSMIDLDINFEEARQYLSMKQDNGDEAVVSTETMELEQVRRQRVNYIRKVEEVKSQRRELIANENQAQERKKLQLKFDEARRQSLVIEAREKKQALLNRAQAIEGRGPLLQSLSSSSSSTPHAVSPPRALSNRSEDGIRSPSSSNDGASLDMSSVNQVTALKIEIEQLIALNGQLLASNDTLRADLNDLELKQRNSTNSTGARVVYQPMSSLCSEEWQLLLNLDPAMRERVLDAMITEMQLHESGERDLPSLEFQVALK